MQPSTDSVRSQLPVVQIYICGRNLIRLYMDDKCVGFYETYKFAQFRADELVKAVSQQEMH